MYLFLLCCLAKYIVDLGELLSKAGRFQWNGDEFIEPSLVLTKRVRYKDKEQSSQRGLADRSTVGKQVKVDAVCRIWPQTKKSTPVRYQKGVHKHLVQGVHRTSPVHKRGKHIDLSCVINTLGTEEQRE